MILHSIKLQAATTLESSGALKRGGNRAPIFNCSFKEKIFKKYCWGVSYFYGVFSWEGGGAFPHSSFKPFRDL